MVKNNMALIRCANCGKRITDRTEICPHCKAVLISRPDSTAAFKKSILPNSLKRLPSVVVATVETFVAAILTRFILENLCYIYMGEDYKQAIIEGSAAFRGRIAVILTIGFAAYGILPIVLKRFIKVKERICVIAISIILAVTFGASYFPRHSIMNLLEELGTPPMYVYPAIGLPFFYATVLPFWQGSSCLLNIIATKKKRIILQAVSIGTSLVLTAVLAYANVVVFRMGTQGAAYAGVLSSIVTFVFSICYTRKMS